MALKHPTTEQLAAYVFGNGSDGMSLLVASHMTYCPACRHAADRLEMLGGSLMEAMPANDVTPPSLDAVLARLDAPHIAGAAVNDAPRANGPTRADLASRTGEKLPFPAPIRQAVQAAGGGLRWRFRLPGVHEHVFGGYDGESVSLLRVRPGRSMPHHTHEGEEATLILSGEMVDDGARFLRGDVALANHNDDHQPRVVGEELCYCLIVLSGAMRFTGPVSRALNLLSR